MFTRTKKLLEQLNLTDFAIKQQHNIRLIKRRVLRIDRKIKKSYFKQNHVKKLHIGCGTNILSGWLNSEYYPKSASILHLDATRSFPFEDNSFDFVFSEHMIEHITFAEAQDMLAECYRTLKRGGRLRISAPDLSFLIELYREEKSDLQREYIQWFSSTLIEWAPYSDATFVINNFISDWGHKFTYDEETLRFSLEKAGFEKVKKCNLIKSEYEELRNLEYEERMPAGYLRLESMTVEGTKT